MSVWYALLDGPQNDVEHIKRRFSNSNLVFDQIDGKFALSAPAFQQLSHDKEQIIAAITELLAAINTSLRLSVKTYTGFELHDLAEKRDDGTTHRTIIAGGGSYSISGNDVVAYTTGVTAVGVAGSIGPPVRSREERLASLLQHNSDIAEVARAMATRPMTWGAMNTAYESVKGLTSTKTAPDKKRGDYQALIDRGWISAEQSDSFYHTAGYHRHGHPQKRSKPVCQKCPTTKRHILSPGCSGDLSTS